MPDISKLSGTLIDSVSKVDGVLKESIASIVGLTVPSGTAYTPPLDTYTGATAAYSVRKLSSTYSGSCIEAYRVSDGATQDIGFDADGLIDTAAIATFGGSSEVTVKTWYDQTSSGADLTKTDTANLPTIYDGASIIEVNGNPAVRIVRVANTGPGEWLQTSSAFVASTAGQMEFFAVFPGSGSAGGGDRFFWDSNAGPTTSGIRWGSFKRNTTFYFNGINYATGNLNQQLVSAGADATTNYIFYNGSQVASGASSGLIRTDPYTATLGAREGGNEGYNTFDIQELIHYPAFQGTNRSGININLNDFYQIANLPASSSGLLYDYPDAAAAYSVRSLSNNAIKCMRVRRTVSPFDEQDIGFDSNGDLDTAAIVTFGGSDPLTVSAWYDQSGQSRHATQVTASAQPQIYDGTAVITENGKPAVEFASDYIASAPFGADVPQPTTYFITVNKTNHSGYLFERVGTGGRQAQGDSTWVFAGSVANGFYPTSDLGSQRLFTALFDGASSISRMNSTATGSGNPGTDGQSGIQIGRPNQSLTGKVQEFVIYGADQTSNFTAIESNINTYFSIY